MLKFGFRREKEQQFKHIAPGLIPSASIAPKPAVPRTPPPRSPSPSPERPRSALAAAILSSSLTGQTWAIPLARPRSFTESDQSESFISEPNISTALYTRGRWSEDNLAVRARLSSPEHSEEELEDKEEEELENEEDGEEHVYQTLNRQESCSTTEPVYALSVKTKSRTRQPSPMSARRVLSPDLSEETSGHSPEARQKKMSARKSPENGTKDVPCSSTPSVATEHLSPAKNTQHLPRQSPEPSNVYSEVRKEKVRDRLEKNVRIVDGQKRLEERLQRLEEEISHSQGWSNLKSSAGSQAELQNLRRHAQELVDENDALKMTVHRLNVELSQYQTRFRPLSKQETSRLSGLPKTGSPPPWLLDMKHLSPLLLAYEDRMNERDALLQTTEEEVKTLRAHVEEVIKENERLHDDISKIEVVSQKSSHQIQEQAVLVLQENQVLIDQLEAQHVKAKASHSRHQSEVTKVSKQLMLLEADKQRLQEELEESRREVQKHVKDVLVLQARLKDSITWDEHCSVTGKLRRQLEHQESRNKSDREAFVIRVSSLQEDNRNLSQDVANLSASTKTMSAELEIFRQANRKAERRMSVLKRQREDSVLEEEKSRHYLSAVISVAELISQERDRLSHMASVLQMEKQGFIGKIVKGTVRLGKLHEDVKVYRRQASTRLAALEESAQGRTASHQREILHLQRLLRERQEAEEKLLQSRRELEEELEVVWRAATRPKQQMTDSLDFGPSGDVHTASPDRTVPVPPALSSTDLQQPQQKHGVDFYC